MTVRELQQLLNRLDPELGVLCYTEDPKFLTAGTHFRLLEIDDVNTIHGERTRLSDGTPYLKLGEGPTSETICTLVVTGDF